MKYKILCLLLFIIIVGINSSVIAQTPQITIERSVNTDNSVVLSYKKEEPGSYFVYLNFSNVTNSNVSNYKTIIDSYSGNLLTLKPSNDKQSIGYALQYYVIFGKPNPKVDSLFHYVLPFKKGKRHKIVEASNLGEKYLGQEKPKNWKSYVINSTTPDTICSMRKGIVVKIDNQYQNSSLDMSFTSKRNSITVEHSDGTIAIYNGFKKNLIFVKLGQTVYPQTELGVIEEFNPGVYRADFFVFYWSDKEINTASKQFFQNYRSKYTYLAPYFVTENGVAQIVSTNEYEALCTEEQLTLEFSRSEKKKYLKEPTLFR